MFAEMGECMSEGLPYQCHRSHQFLPMAAMQTHSCRNADWLTSMRRPSSGLDV